MEIISFNEAATANGRIEKFNANPDSNSGIVTVPKVIGAVESVTIPAGRVAVLPNVQVDGTLNVEGEVFIPSGATFSKVVETEGNQDIDGVKTFTSSPLVPTPTTGTQVANKDYVDYAANSQPSNTGSITLNGTTNNTVVMTDIVTKLRLEVGDVIRINTGAYNKLHTVESITNNGSIIVNYEHAGNMGNGSLKLPNFTGQATVTRIAKWFNAPMGLGQNWINMSDRRSSGVNYQNGTNRTISIAVSFSGGGPATKGVYVDGMQLYTTNGSIGTSQERAIPPNTTYKFEGPLSTDGTPLQELR